MPVIVRARRPDECAAVLDLRRKAEAPMVARAEPHAVAFWTTAPAGPRPPLAPLRQD